MTKYICPYGADTYPARSLVVRSNSSYHKKFSANHSHLYGSVFFYCGKLTGATIGDEIQFVAFHSTQSSHSILARSCNQWHKLDHLPCRCSLSWFCAQPIRNFYSPEKSGKFHHLIWNRWCTEAVFSDTRHSSVSYESLGLRSVLFQSRLDRWNRMIWWSRFFCHLGVGLLLECVFPLLKVLWQVL